MVETFIGTTRYTCRWNQKQALRDNPCPHWFRSWFHKIFQHRWQCLSGLPPGLPQPANIPEPFLLFRLPLFAVVVLHATHGAGMVCSIPWQKQWRRHFRVKIKNSLFHIHIQTNAVARHKPRQPRRSVV